VAKHTRPLFNGTFTASFAGLVGVGLFQINFTVPPDLTPGDYPPTIRVGNASSQTGVIIPVA